MAWIDYRKAYDVVPYSWIIESLEMFGIAENVKKYEDVKNRVNIIGREARSYPH